MIPAMTTGMMHFIMRSGRRTPIAEIPTPDLAVPYDAPRPVRCSGTGTFGNVASSHRGWEGGQGRGQREGPCGDRLPPAQRTGEDDSGRAAPAEQISIVSLACVRRIGARIFAHRQSSNGSTTTRGAGCVPSPSSALRVHSHGAEERSIDLTSRSERGIGGARYGGGRQRPRARAGRGTGVSSIRDSGWKQSRAPGNARGSPRRMRCCVARQPCVVRAGAGAGAGVSSGSRRVKGGTSAGGRTTTRRTRAASDGAGRAGWQETRTLDSWWAGTGQRAWRREGASTRPTQRGGSALHQIGRPHTIQPTISFLITTTWLSISTVRKMHCSSYPTSRTQHKCESNSVSMMTPRARYPKRNSPQRPDQPPAPDRQPLARAAPRHRVHLARRRVRERRRRDRLDLLRRRARRRGRRLRLRQVPQPERRVVRYGQEWRVEHSGVSQSINLNQLRMQLPELRLADSQTVASHPGPDVSPAAPPDPPAHIVSPPHVTPFTGA